MLIIIAFLAAIIGFGIAVYIYRKQESKKPLMCPRKAPCETVLSSPQATTLGISNSILGMVFYAVILFLLTLLGTSTAVNVLKIVFGLLTLSGFAFSVYLVWVQKTKIKQWCVWCLGSAAMSTILFIVALLILF
jgi:uncharacterized membrane protein